MYIWVLAYRMNLYDEFVWQVSNMASAELPTLAADSTDITSIATEVNELISVIDSFEAPACTAN